MSTHHDRSNDELRERAQDYVLGTLDAQQRTAMALHLSSGCVVCNRDVQDAEALVAGLAFAAPAAAPRPEIKEQLLARVRSGKQEAAPSSAADPARIQVWKQWAAPSGPPPKTDFLQTAEEGVFEPTAAPGVFVRKLYVDVANNRATMVVRMDPGSSYPGHRHGDGEECYVLSGELCHGDRVMRAGDFERVGTGSTHGKQWTETGCLLLIHSSLSDELLES